MKWFTYFLKKKCPLPCKTVPAGKYFFLPFHLKDLLIEDYLGKNSAKSKPKCPQPLSFEKSKILITYEKHLENSITFCLCSNCLIPSGSLNNAKDWCVLSQHNIAGPNKTSPSKQSWPIDSILSMLIHLTSSHVFTSVIHNMTAPLCPSPIFPNKHFQFQCSSPNCSTTFLLSAQQLVSETVSVIVACLFCFSTLSHC